jgi:hypothetical protein
MKPVERIGRLILPAILLLSSAAPHGQTPALAATQDPAAKMVQLLEASGYSYTKASDKVWAVPFEGKALAKFNVVVSTQQDLVERSISNLT